MKYLLVSLLLFYLLWCVYAFVTKMKKQIKFVQEQIYGKTIHRGNMKIRYTSRHTTHQKTGEASEYTDFEEIK